MSQTADQVIVESIPSVSRKSKRVKISKAARKYAQVYDKHNQLNVKELRDKIKSLGVDTPLSRLSKDMLIAIIHENTREKKIKIIKKKNEEEDDPIEDINVLYQV